MKVIEHINMDDYNYVLPEQRIAHYPKAQRDQSRLLIYNKNISHDHFHKITNYLPKNHLIVFNNTKVIQARILFQKSTGATIEVFCLEPHKPSDYNLAFQAKRKISWKCIVGNAKKWKSGTISSKYTIDNQTYTLFARRLEKSEKESIIEFTWESTHVFGDILESIGKTPIPPYIKRKAEEIDKERYQTVYSKFKGSVAAPTAGLHFTSKILQELELRNIHTEEVTLHVGAGTFQPVKSGNISDHEMHTEHFSVSLHTIEQLLNYENKIISVGTTTVRTLESIYWLGVQILENRIQEMPLIAQWEAYEHKNEISANAALEALKAYLINTKQAAIEAITQIIIVPGYRYKMTNHLITNFHQPGSTLLLLVAAAIGEEWKAVYNYALANDFRFLSYGDSCLFLDIK